MLNAFRETSDLMLKAHGPLVSEVHVDGPLTQMSIASFQDEEGFVATKVFPICRVNFKSDTYFQFNPDEFNRDDMQIVGDAEETKGGGFNTTTGNYSCSVYGYHKDIGGQLRANSDPQVDLEELVSRYLTLKYLIHLERKFVTNFFSSSIWGNDITGVPGSVLEPGATQCLQWDDADSNPIEVVRYWKRYMKRTTGIEANTMVLTRDVKDALLDHPDFIDRVNRGQTPGGAAKGTLARIQELFEIENIYVMDAIYNTAKKGAAANNDFIASRKALLCHAAPQPSLMSPSGGYTFAWNYAPLTEGGMGQVIDKMPIPLVRNADRYEIQCAYDMKVTGSTLGVFFDELVGTDTPNA